jgi:hypothetical protein
MSHFDQFIKDLSSYDAGKSDNVVDDLYDILESVEELEVEECIIDPIFDFIDKYPDADMGNPGPLVHLLEKLFPIYIFRLAESLYKKASYSNLAIAGRAFDINVLSKESYSKLKYALESVPESDDYFDLAEEILAR